MGMCVKRHPQARCLDNHVPFCDEYLRDTWKYPGRKYCPVEVFVMRRGVLWPVIGGAALGAAVVYLTVFRFLPNMTASPARSTQNKNSAGKRKGKGRYDYGQSQDQS